MFQNIFNFGTVLPAVRVRVSQTTSFPVSMVIKGTEKRAFPGSYIPSSKYFIELKIYVYGPCCEYRGGPNLVPMIIFYNLSARYFEMR